MSKASTPEHGKADVPQAQDNLPRCGNGQKRCRDDDDLIWVELPDASPGESVLSQSGASDYDEAGTLDAQPEVDGVSPPPPPKRRQRPKQDGENHRLLKKVARLLFGNQGGRTLNSQGIYSPANSCACKRNVFVVPFGAQGSEYCPLDSMLRLCDEKCGKEEKEKPSKELLHMLAEAEKQSTTIVVQKGQNKGRTSSSQTKTSFSIECSSLAICVVQPTRTTVAESSQCLILARQSGKYKAIGLVSFKQETSKENGKQTPCITSMSFDQAFIQGVTTEIHEETKQYANKVSTKNQKQKANAKAQASAETQARPHAYDWSMARSANGCMMPSYGLQYVPSYTCLGDPEDMSRFDLLTGSNIPGWYYPDP